MTEAKRRILKSGSQPIRIENIESDPDIQQHEMDSYSRSMFSTFRFTGVAAGLLYSMQWFLAMISNISTAESTTPKIPYPSANIEAAGVAVTLLITSAIAVQVFLRLPRDPERFTREDAVEHHQFWGPIATLIAVGSAFLIPYVIVDALISSVETGVLNLGQALGIPLVAVIALIFASDAVTIISEEARREDLVQKIREMKIRSLTQARGRIAGNQRKHPTAALVWHSLLVGSALVGAATWAAWSLMHQPVLTFTFAVLSLISTAGMVLVCTQSIPTVIRGRILESIFQLLLPALAIVIVSMQSIVLALPYITDPTKPESYIPALAYGLLVAVPPFVTVAILAVLKFPRNHTAPLMDFARNQLTILIGRYKKDNAGPPPEGATWKLLSGSAIILSLVPFVALFLSAGAIWHRSHSSKGSKILFVAGWLFPVLGAIAETLAVLFIAYYGPEFGWFKLCASSSNC